jgi:hypothetical protein
MASLTPTFCLSARELSINMVERNKRSVSRVAPTVLVSRAVQELPYAMTGMPFQYKFA